MALSPTERSLLANAVTASIQVHGLKATRDKGARGLLASLLNVKNQKESLAKCNPKDRELVEARFQALKDNQGEAMQIINIILNPQFKDSKE